MHLTVAICTWNRSALLRQTLQQMASLEIPLGVTWELLVVNNNCTDETSAALASFAHRLPIQELQERTPGQSHARNRAVQAARGEYIVWTDDDVLVAPDWLRAYNRAIAEWPQAVYFGGVIEPQFAVEPPDWIRQNLDLLEGTFAVRNLGPDTCPLRKGEFPFGANMAFRTEILRRLPFDGALGRNGAGQIRGDETAIFRELEQSGQIGIWVGPARVKHYLPAERLTLGYVWRFFQGGGRTFIRQKGNPGWKSWGGMPRWALRQCATGATRTLLLAPFRSRAWVGALRDTAKALGTLQEARAQHVSARQHISGGTP